MKCIHILLILLLNSALTFGYSTGITIGTWGQALSSNLMDPGTYIQLGMVRGITDRFEAELFTAVQVTPLPGSTLYAGAGLIFSAAGPREHTDDRIPPYYNALFSAGVLAGMNELYHGPSDIKTAIYLRFTPLALKGPYYGKRERAATAGLMYCLHDQSISAFWNILLYDFY